MKKKVRSRRERRFHLLGSVWIFFLMFTFGFWRVHLETAIRTKDYLIHEEIKKKKKLEKERDEWRRKVSYFHSPYYLGREGRKLGMVELEVSKIRVLE